MQVGIDAIRGTRQCDAMDQEHKEDKVRQGGCDPDNLSNRQDACENPTLTMRTWGGTRTRTLDPPCHSSSTSLVLVLEVPSSFQGRVLGLTPAVEQ